MVNVVHQDMPRHRTSGRFGVGGNRFQRSFFAFEERALNRCGFWQSVQGDVAVFGTGQIENATFAVCVGKILDFRRKQGFPKRGHCSVVRKMAPRLGHLKTDGGIPVQGPQHAIHPMKDHQTALGRFQSVWWPRRQVKGFEGIATTGPSRHRCAAAHPILVPVVHGGAQGVTQLQLLLGFFHRPPFQPVDDGLGDLPKVRVGKFSRCRHGRVRRLEGLGG